MTDELIEPEDKPADRNQETEPKKDKAKSA